MPEETQQNNNEIESKVEIQNQKNEWENTELNEYETINKNYKLIYSIVFKYGMIILVIILAIIIFIIEIQKNRTLSFEDSHQIEKIWIISRFNKETDNTINDENLKIYIKHWTLDFSENLLHSYNNLINYKWFTMPRATLIYEPNELPEKDIFDDPNYDTQNLQKIIDKTIFVNYSDIWLKQSQAITQIPLENNSIEETFFISCANKVRIFNGVCNNYINNFLESFFVYKISDDFEWFTKTIKNIIWKKNYKDAVCSWLKNYIIYTNTAPSAIEDIAINCWGDYLELYSITQDFVVTKNELENKYIKPKTSKYQAINEYKLISYQQILYNNIENWIPPYEWTYKDYTDYIATLLKKSNQVPVSPVYYDITFWFNNLYIIPQLTKIKYQSTASKREEIESIISEIEKMNNWSPIDWYVGLKNIVTNKMLEEEIKKIWSNINSSTDDIMTTLLKNLKSLSFLKIINDEIDWNKIKTNWYLTINIKWDMTPIFFWATFENEKWYLIVKEFTLSEYDELNETLWIIISQKDYSISEIYEYIQNNISLYISQNMNLTPCDLIKNRLTEQNIWEIKILHCDDNKLNLIKWWPWNKILYQIKMEKYNINSITVSNKKIQAYVDNNFSNINTNSVTIANIISNIVAYEPPKDISQALEWSNNAIIAIDDFKNYLWVDVKDIAEQNGRIAAEFTINKIDFIWIYDTNTKKLWPIFLKQTDENDEEIKFNTFSLYLTQENQNEINRFLIETIQYLKGIDATLVNKYIDKESE